MDDESQTSTDRRSREVMRRARRHRRVNMLGTILTLGIVVIVTLVATDTLRLGGTGPTLASGKTTLTNVTAPTNANPEIARIKRESPPRPLSHAAPLRLWIGGDSLSGELGFQLGPLVSKLGVVQAHVDYKVSSGLASNNIRDWPTHFEQEQSQYRPEAVIFMIGANDAPIVSSALDATGTPAWEATYRGQVDRMMDLLVGGSTPRTVFWIGSPTLGTSENHGAEEVDRVMREEAAKRPTVVYIDAYSLFSANGQYSASLTDAHGNPVQMRVGDGVHFTIAGAEYLAAHVYTLLNARWNLDGQAVPATPIEYTIEPAFDTVGGVPIGNGSNGSNSGSGSGTTVPPTTTPPPTTAPRATVPPTTRPLTTTTTKPPPTTTSPPTT
jgi:hypothetical protein